MFQTAHEAYPNTRHWLMLCDHDNNNGDGYVVVGLAKALGLEITLLAQGNDKSLPKGTQHVRDVRLSASGIVHAADIN